MRALYPEVGHVKLAREKVRGNVDGPENLPLRQDPGAVKFCGRRPGWSSVGFEKAP